MSGLTGYALSKTNSHALASPESFEFNRRCRATFGGDVHRTRPGATHPRCVNCHPAGDRPRQGDESRLHQPPVTRGADGHGLPAMRCSICHQDANFDPGRVPGHPEWHLAPREMAWEGKTVPEICAQIKDPARNGGRTPEDLIHHIGEDTLVGLGLEAGLWPFARARHPADRRSVGRSVGSHGSSLSR